MKCLWCRKAQSTVCGRGSDIGPSAAWLDTSWGQEKSPVTRIELELELALRAANGKPEQKPEKELKLELEQRVRARIEERTAVHSMAILSNRPLYEALTVKAHTIKAE